MPEQNDLRDSLIAILDGGPPSVTADEAIARADDARAVTSTTPRYRPARLPRRGALAWLAAVIVLVSVLVGVRVASSGSGSAPAHPGPGSSKSLPFAKNWVPVDYGDVQVSVPGSWTIGAGCPPGVGRVDVGIRPPRFCFPVRQDGQLNFVYLGYRAPDPRPGGRQVVINGRTMFELPEAMKGEQLIVPSLSAEIIAVGPLSAEIEKTIEPSPVSTVLAGGPAPAIPSSWRQVTYGGLSFDVPPTWPIETATQAGGSYHFCSGPYTLASPPSVVEYTGEPGSGDVCFNPGITGISLSAPADGLAVDPEPGAPFDAEHTFTTCEAVNGLSACQVVTDPVTDTAVPALESGYILLKVTIPGSAHSVAVEIGLGGNGTIARTIFHSMRSIGASRPSTSTPEPPTTIKTDLAGTPLLIAPGYSGREPAAILFSADAGNIVQGLTWSTWTSGEATGYGTSNYEACIPDCAAGKVTPEVTTVVLSDPRDGHFSKLVEYRMGTSVTFMYPRPWPLSASDT